MCDEKNEGESAKQRVLYRLLKVTISIPQPGQYVEKDPDGIWILSFVRTQCVYTTVSSEKETTYLTNQIVKLTRLEYELRAECEPNPEYTRPEQTGT